MMAGGRLRQAEAFLQFGELEDALAALDALLDEQPGDDAARRLRASMATPSGVSARMRQVV